METQLPNLAASADDAHTPLCKEKRVRSCEIWSRLHSAAFSSHSTAAQASENFPITEKHSSSSRPTEDEGLTLTKIGSATLEEQVKTLESRHAAPSLDVWAMYHL